MERSRYICGAGSCAGVLHMVSQTEVGPRFRCAKCNRAYVAIFHLLSDDNKHAKRAVGKHVEAGEFELTPYEHMRDIEARLVIMESRISDLNHRPPVSRPIAKVRTGGKHGGKVGKTAS